MRQPLPGDVVQGYQIIELLGEGAFSRVFLACPIGGGAKVVLKVPDVELLGDPATYERLQREISVARDLSHPNVQGIREARLDASPPFLVLEYVEARTLRSILAAEGVLSPDRVADLGRQVAEGLCYLHARGVVHRDLKPENLLVTPEGRVLISDFGSAVRQGMRRLTWKHLSGAVGTPDYMSPEQIQGERGDERSDLYALGIIMYEALVGRVPFEGDNWLAVMAGHLQRSPAPLERVAPGVPARLASIVHHLIRRDPAKRYQCAREVVEDLASDEPLRPEVLDRSPEPPIGEPSQRHTMRLVLIGIVATAVVALAVVVAVAVH